MKKGINISHMVMNVMTDQVVCEKKVLVEGKEKFEKCELSPNCS